MIFIDESGFLLIPHFRRSWAPRGQTPVFHHVMGRLRKVSAIAALSVTACGRRPKFYFRLYPDANINAVRCLDFLRQLKQNTRGKVILVWDRLQVHRAARVKRFFVQNRRFSAIELPPYAPELNPVEYVWSYLKQHSLANQELLNESLLYFEAKQEICKMRKKKNLLGSFLRLSPLFF